jgi:hypothetical protein
VNTEDVCGGIDPGKTGGIVVLRHDRSIMLHKRMPLDGKDFDYRGWINWVVELDAEFSANGIVVLPLYIEITFQQIRGVRGDTLVQAPLIGGHEFARVAGAQMAGACILGQAHVKEVHADAWRKTVGLSQDPLLRGKYTSRELWKKAAKEACQRLWPGHPVAKHPGTADAALIALAALEDWRRR